MTKKQLREQRALEAIMAGILRGYTTEDWRKVFEKVEQIKKARRRPRP